MKNTRVCARDGCDKRTKRKEKKFCSRECWNLHLHEGETYPKTKTCEECETSFTVVFSSREQKFCSRSCAVSCHNRGIQRNFRTKQCAGCENLILSESTYCTVECRKNHTLRLWLSGEKLPKQIPSASKTYRPFIWAEQGEHCALCPQTEIWQGQPLTFVLDHVDGNSEDNRRENLRLVCPNCDSQLPTFKSRNKGNGRHFRRQRYAEGKSF